MADEDVIKIINDALAEEFELDEAEMKPESHLVEDFELDSLDFVDMVIVLQKAFNFKLRDENAIREIRTLGDVHALVIKKKKEVESGGEPEQSSESK
jgi:acyl carrier protein